MKQLSQILEASRWDKSQPHKLIGLHQNLAKHYNNYDEYQEGAIKDYTTDSKKINSYHWDRREENTSPRNKDTSMENKTQDMDAATDQHRTPHKLTVYSGVKNDIRDNLDNSSTFKHPAYLSTSLNKHEAKFFSNIIPNKNTGNLESHILKINVPKDHPGAYVEHKSINQGEKEFILPRNTRLNYKGSTTYKKEDTALDNDVVEHNMDII